MSSFIKDFDMKTYSIINFFVELLFKNRIQNSCKFL